jgi:hypothetical protein
MKITNRKTCAAIAAALAAVGFSAPASAQATRTWVSGVGDDVNPCSRTAPCKTFAGAISKTAAGGEINCIDPGGFGGVTITKSIAIICDDVEAGVLVSASNGITINAAATDSIFLSGLDIHGTGNGIKGVRYLAGGAVHIANSTIHKFQGANGAGISFAPSAAGNLIVSDTTILNNGNGATGGGIEIIPTGSANSKVVLQNVQVEGNANVGIRVDMSGTTGGSVSVVMEDSHVVGGPAGITVNAAGAGSARMMIVRSEIANNFGAGLTASGVNALVRVSDSTITGNTSGVNATNSAAINSYGDNRLDGNPAIGAANNGAFTGAVLPKR